MLDDQVNELKFLGDSSVLFLENFLLTQTILMDFISLLARIFDTFHDTVQFSCLSFDLFLLGLIPLLNLYLLRFLLFQLLLFTSFLLLTFLEFDLHLHQLLLLLSLLLFVFIPLNNLTLHFLYLLQCLFLLFFLPRYFFIFFTQLFLQFFFLLSARQDLLLNLLTLLATFFLELLSFALNLFF